MSLLNFDTVLIHSDGFFSGSHDDTVVETVNKDAYNERKNTTKELVFSPRGIVYEKDTKKVVQDFARTMGIDSDRTLVKHWSYNGTDFKTKFITFKHAAPIAMTKFMHIDVWAYVLQGPDISLYGNYSKEHAKYLNKFFRQHAHLDTDIVKVINKRDMWKF